MTLEDLEDRVNGVIDEVNLMMDEDYNSIMIDNKNIDMAMKEHLHIQIKWESVVSMVNGLMEECSLMAEEVFSNAFHDRMVNDNRTWSTTDAKILASGDSRYVAAKRLENQCKTIKRDAEGYLRVIETRKYTLKNLTSLIIAGSDKYIL